LYVDLAQAASLDNAEIYNKWKKLCPHDALFYQDMAREDPFFLKKLEQWKERLTSISWFMKFLNEGIARVSNQEDNCKGRFWESRFK
jgi:hypothetical protein